MCGICGFTGKSDQKALKRMTAAMYHRGPDDAGYWEQPDRIALGMRRLAVVDIDTGRQPSFSANGDITVVFNGEIYNHIELRRSLERKGYRFRSQRSDTEVIVYLYKEYGDKCLHHLNGMFAIALWDKPAERLILARDRIGIKPLYYAWLGKDVVFGSEIKSLLQHPAISKQPNFQALYHYFSFKHVPAPLSAIEGIAQLMPGEMAVFQEGVLETRRWWEVDFDSSLQIDEEEASKEIRRLLEDSVRLQMRSDVQVGAYLSGGVDSSSVVALMAGKTSERLKTFSLIYDSRFANKTADQVFARQIAKQYNTDHFEYMLDYNEVIESTQKVLDAFDDPFSGVTSTYFLTQMISKHVKVALSGDGADELFGSYLPHRLAIPMHHYAQHSARIDRLDDNLLTPYRHRKDYLAALSSHGGEAEWRMALYLMNDTQKERLFTADMRAQTKGISSVGYVKEFLDKSPSQDPLNRMLNLDFQTLLPDQVLTFVDRLSMAHSVEVRPPFLDHRIVEFVVKLTGHMKIKHGRVKHILKEAVSGLLPPDVIDRPKEGFVLPINEWLTTSLKDYAESTLSDENLAKHGLLEPNCIREILHEHYSGKEQHGARIWNLIMFQLWWEKQFT